MDKSLPRHLMFRLTMCFEWQALISRWELQPPDQPNQLGDMAFIHEPAQDYGFAISRYLNFNNHHCNQNFMTEVFNQGYNAACAAFAVSNAVSARWWYDYGEKIFDLSKQQLLDCVEVEDRSYSFAKLYNYVMDYGLYKEEDYEYDPRFVGRCRYNDLQGSYRLGMYDWYRLRETRYIIAALQEFPITASMPVYRSFTLLSNKPAIHDVYEPDAFEEPMGEARHGVLVVGYGYQNGGLVYAIKNSWDIDWGLNGYCLVKEELLSHFSCPGVVKEL